MFKVAVGHSEDVDAEDAIQEILKQCHDELGALEAQAGILYSSIDYDYQILLDAINIAHPGIELIGCTVDGELSSKMGFLEDSVALVLFSSDEVDIKAGVAEHVPTTIEGGIKDSISATQGLSDKEAKLCIINPLSLTASGSVILDEFKKHLGDEFPIYGLSSADQWQFKQTYQFYKNSVLTDAIPFLIFSGPLLFGSGVSTGWRPRGDVGVVSRVENNVLFEVDNQSAVAFYQKYLGKGLHFGDYPLAIFEDPESDEFYLRAPIVTNEEDGSVLFTADIPEHVRVQITYGVTENLIAASKESIDLARESYGGKKPEVVICFSCSGRRQVLGGRTKEEFELLQDFYPNIKAFGGYGFGEIAPITAGGPSKFHNETFVTLLLGSE